MVSNSFQQSMTCGTHVSSSYLIAIDELCHGEWTAAGSMWGGGRQGVGRYRCGRRGGSLLLRRGGGEEAGVAPGRHPRWGAVTCRGGHLVSGRHSHRGAPTEGTHAGEASRGTSEACCAGESRWQVTLERRRVAQRRKKGKNGQSSRGAFHY